MLGASAGITGSYYWRVRDVFRQYGLRVYIHRGDSLAFVMRKGDTAFTKYKENSLHKGPAQLNITLTHPSGKPNKPAHHINNFSVS